MLKLKHNGSYLAEMSVAVNSMLVENFKHSDICPPSVASRTMLKIKNGKMYFVDNKTSRPLLEFDVKTEIFSVTTRYKELEASSAKMKRWIDYMHSSIKEIIIRELKIIHSKSYPEGKTALV